MEQLVRSIADFFAAVLGLVGFVGKPRRRAGIRDDMLLVTELAEHPDFGRGSWPHQALMNRVALDVGKLAGVPLRKTPWSSVALALLIGVPCAWFAWTINQDGFEWYSLFPAATAAFMVIAILGMLVPSQDESATDGGDEFTVRPLAGDINAEIKAERLGGSENARAETSRGERVGAKRAHHKQR